jgi:hypothetical protein
MTTERLLSSSRLRVLRGSEVEVSASDVARPRTDAWWLDLHAEYAAIATESDRPGQVHFHKLPRCNGPQRFNRLY